jgi:transposase-like protein
MRILYGLLQSSREVAGPPRRIRQLDRRTSIGRDAAVAFLQAAVSSEVICKEKRQRCGLLGETSVTARHNAKEIVSKLRFIGELAASGRTISDCLQEIGVTEVTYYRWRNRYGGLESDQAERLMELEAEIARLRKAVSDLTLDKLVLVEATTGSLSPELRSTYVLHAKSVLGISERRACQALGQHRSTQRKIQARLNDSREVGHEDGRPELGKNSICKGSHRGGSLGIR